jgi:hypothetical protein
MGTNVVELKLEAEGPFVLGPVGEVLGVSAYGLLCPWELESKAREKAEEYLRNHPELR